MRHTLVWTALILTLPLAGCFSPDAEVESASTDGGSSGTGDAASGEASTSLPPAGSTGSATTSAEEGGEADETGSTAGLDESSGTGSTTVDTTDSDDTGPEPVDSCSTHLLFGRDGVVWMVDASTGEESQLTGSGLPDDDLPFDRDYSWSADGESVLVRRSASAGNPTQLLRVGLDGEVEVLAESGSGLINPRSPTTNEDGSEIAFLIEAPNAIDANVVLMNPDGSGQVVVETSPLGSFFFAWSEVSFSSTLSNVVVLNDTSLHYVELPSGNSLELLDVSGSGENLAQVDLTGSGQVVAYVRLGSGDDPFADSDIVVLNANGSGTANLTSNTEAGSYAPQWSPDGDFIAFTRRVGTDEELFWMSADGSEQENLSNAGGNDVWHSWSPDGRELAFVSNRSGENRFHTVQVADGETTDLSDAETIFPDFELWRTQGVPQWRPCDP